MSRHLQLWPSASCTMYIVCTCSTAHSFPVLIYAPAFAVADHRGQDPASSVLSFEGRCYLLIQIQIQNVVYIINLLHTTQRCVYKIFVAYRPLGARMQQIEILSKLSLWVHHVVHTKIYQKKNPRLENRTFYPLFWKVNFAPDYYWHFRWEQEGSISSWCGYGCSD